MGIIFDQAIAKENKGEYAKNIQKLGDGLDADFRLKNALKQSQEIVYKMQGDREKQDRQRKIE